MFIKTIVIALYENVYSFSSNQNASNFYPSYEIEFWFLKLNLNPEIIRVNLSAIGKYWTGLVFFA